VAEVRLEQDGFECSLAYDLAAADEGTDVSYVLVVRSGKKRSEQMVVGSNPC
jgi:hypothetical protein